MARKPPKNRRTILTLQADSLDEAHSESAPLHAASERSEEVLKGYKKAFSGLSDEEVAILDGVILE